MGPVWREWLHWLNSLRVTLHMHMQRRVVVLMPIVMQTLSLLERIE